MTDGRYAVQLDARASHAIACLGAPPPACAEPPALVTVGGYVPYVPHPSAQHSPSDERPMVEVSAPRTPRLGTLATLAQGEKKHPNPSSSASSYTPT